MAGFLDGCASTVFESGTREDAENPLLNHLIVSKILAFGKLNFEELKKFRLVCSLWYTLSLDQWRQSVFLKLVENRDNQLISEDDGTGVTLNEICDLFNPENSQNDFYQLAKKPYSKYKLKGWISICPKENLDSIRQNTQFWRDRLALLIKYLKIEDCYFPDSKPLEEKLFPCENLEELVLAGNSITICRGYEIPAIIPDDMPILRKLKSLTVNGAMPLQWSKMLLHTPNLESLTIKQNLSYCRTTFASFLLDLHELEIAGINPKNIKHLDIMEADDTFTDFVALSSRDLKLESLSVQFDKIRPEHFMQPLLLAQKGTLKILKLCRVSDRDVQPFGQFEFPYGVNMMNLRELYLWGDIVKNWGFLRSTPNLKSLYISRDKFNGKRKRKLETGEILEDFLGQNEIPPEMDGLVWSKLEVFDVNCRFSVDSVRLLQKWMPNLKTIRCVVNDETLKVICDGWPCIREIYALSGSVLDDLSILNVTGLVKFQTDVDCNGLEQIAGTIDSSFT